MYLIFTTQDRGLVTNSCVHGTEPLDSIKSGEFLDRVTISFSRRALLSGNSYL